MLERRQLYRQLMATILWLVPHRTAASFGKGTVVVGVKSLNPDDCYLLDEYLQEDCLGRVDKGLEGTPWWSWLVLALVLLVIIVVIARMIYSAWQDRDKNKDRKERRRKHRVQGCGWTRKESRDSTEMQANRRHRGGTNMAPAPGQFCPPFLPEHAQQPGQHRGQQLPGHVYQHVDQQEQQHPHEQHQYQPEPGHQQAGHRYQAGPTHQQLGHPAVSYHSYPAVRQGSSSPPRQAVQILMAHGELHPMDPCLEHAHMHGQQACSCPEHAELLQEHAGGFFAGELSVHGHHMSGQLASGRHLHGQLPPEQLLHGQPQPGHAASVEYPPAQYSAAECPRDEEESAGLPYAQYRKSQRSSIYV